MSIQGASTPNSPKEKAFKNFILSLLAFIALAVACIAIGVAGFGVPFGIMALATIGSLIALFIAGTALSSLGTASLRITPRVLDNLARDQIASGFNKDPKLAKVLAKALAQQWTDSPALFKDNFETLRTRPELMRLVFETKISTGPLKETPSSPRFSLSSILIDSPKQTEAAEFITGFMQTMITADQLSLNLTPLKYIELAILANNEPLAQKLTECPNVDLNDQNFQRNHTLLMILIAKPASTDQIKILLNLKNKDGQPLVNPDWLVDNKTTALEKAVRANSYNISAVVQLLKEYGAKNYGSLSVEAISKFETDMNITVGPSLYAEKTELAARSVQSGSTEKIESDINPTNLKKESPNQK